MTDIQLSLFDGKDAPQVFLDDFKLLSELSLDDLKTILGITAKVFDVNVEPYEEVSDVFKFTRKKSSKLISILKFVCDELSSISSQDLHNDFLKMEFEEEIISKLDTFFEQVKTSDELKILSKYTAEQNVLANSPLITAIGYEVSKRAHYKNDKLEGFIPIIEITLKIKTLDEIKIINFQTGLSGLNKLIKDLSESYEKGKLLEEQ